MKITHCQSYKGYVAASTFADANPQFQKECLDAVTEQPGLLDNPASEYIAATFFNGENAIDGLSISHDDQHPDDLYLFLCLDEHIRQMKDEWTHGVLYIMRGDSISNELQMTLIEFDNTPADNSYGLPK